MFWCEPNKKEMGNAQQAIESATTQALTQTTESKYWTINPCEQDPHPHEVILRHNTFTGARDILIDGQSVHQSSKFIDDGDNLPITIGERKGTIKIFANMYFQYELKFDGETIQEDMENNESLTDVKLTIRVTGFNQEGSNVTYSIETKALDVKCVVNKRFSEIDDLDSKIKISLKNSHFAENLPSFPEKKLALFTDHTSQDFLEGRRQDLHRYFQNLVGVPRVIQNKDLRLFLFPDLEQRRSVFHRVTTSC